MKCLADEVPSAIYSAVPESYTYCQVVLDLSDAFATIVLMVWGWMLHMGSYYNSITMMY